MMNYFEKREARLRQKRELEYKQKELEIRQMTMKRAYEQASAERGIDPHSSQVAHNIFYNEPKVNTPVFNTAEKKTAQDVVQEKDARLKEVKDWYKEYLMGDGDFGLYNNLYNNGLKAKTEQTSEEIPYIPPSSTTETQQIVVTDGVNTVTNGVTGYTGYTGSSGVPLKVLDGNGGYTQYYTHPDDVPGIGFRNEEEYVKPTKAPVPSSSFVSWTREEKDDYYGRTEDYSWKTSRSISKHVYYGEDNDDREINHEKEEFMKSVRKIKFQ